MELARCLGLDPVGRVSNDACELSMKGVDVGKADWFDIFITANGRGGNFQYRRALSADAGWVAGDRCGYAFAYGFILREDVCVARFAFHKVEYCVIDDKYMAEGQRYWDGSIPAVPKKQLYKPGNFPGINTPYVAHTGSYPTAPLIQFYDGTTLLDTRNYALDPQTGTGEPFQYDWAGDQTPTHVGFVAYQLQPAGGNIGGSGQDEPVFAVYYDLLTSDLTMTNNA